MSEIIVVRHGQASFHSDNYDQLSSLGEQQADKLGKHLAEMGIRPDLIVSGDLRRQIETAQIINRHLKVDTSSCRQDLRLREHKGPRVVEQNVQRYVEQEGWIKKLYDHYQQDPVTNIQSYIQIYNHITLQWAEGRITSEYQPWESFYEDAAQGLQSLYEDAEDQQIVIVTSSGPAAVATAMLHGLGPIGGIKLSWQVQNSSATYIDRTRHGLLLRYFNDLSHLTIQERTTV